MKTRVQHPVTSSRSVRDTVRKFVEKHPGLARGLAKGLAFGGALLFCAVTASAKEKPTEVKKPAISGEQVSGAKKEILIADAGPEKGKLIVVADSGKGTAGVSSGQGKSSGPDPLAGTITVDELTSLEKPQSSHQIGDVDSTSDFKFYFNGHKIAGVVNVCYISNSGCNPSGVDVVFVLTADRKYFTDGNFLSERDRYNRENSGKELTHFNYRVDLSGRDAVIFLTPNGEFTPGNFVVRLVVNPDFETNGRPGISGSLLRINQ